MRNNTTQNFIIIGLLGTIVVGGLAFGLPQYGVYTKTLNGKAQLQEAEFTRQVAVLEAKAKLDSAKELALAEIERAKGVAQANQIIGDSLKGNNDYLSYLWITGLEEGNKNGNKTVYMIPSQGNIPAPVFNVDK
jgi:regulator of protease activity HflC (stomatin/prohibitin superfamily)